MLPLVRAVRSAVAVLLLAGFFLIGHSGREAQAANLPSCVPSDLRQTIANIQSQFGPVTVISTFRAGARIAGSGKPSYHASCRAIDFHPPAGKYAQVVAWLKANHKGGVGTYSCGANHVHIDNGPAYRYHHCKGGGGSKQTRTARATNASDS